MRCRCPSRGQWLKLGLLVALLSIGVVVLATHSGRQGLFDSIQWARNHQAKAFVFFILAFAVGAVIHLPEILLAIASGYIFDNLFIVVLATDLGATLGAILAGFVGRFLLRDTFVALVVQNFRSFAALDAISATPRAWRILLLLRIPFVPYIAINFALSVTQVHYWTYTWTTAVGLLPGCLVFGLIGKGVQQLEDLKASVHSDPLVLILSIGGLVVCIVVFGLVRWYVLRELDRGTIVTTQEAILGVEPIPSDDDEEDFPREKASRRDDIVIRIPGHAEDQFCEADTGLSSPEGSLTSSISSPSVGRRSPKKA